MAKVSNEKDHNLFWYFDKRNPKMLINIIGLFETHLDATGSRMFANFKKNAVNNYMKYGYYPNTLMSEVSRAENDYQKLKEMFKLK
jgi:hypothetical protein